MVRGVEGSARKRGNVRGSGGYQGKECTWAQWTAPPPSVSCSCRGSWGRQLLGLGAPFVFPPAPHPHPRHPLCVRACHAAGQDGAVPGGGAAGERRAVRVKRLPCVVGCCCVGTGGRHVWASFGLTIMFGQHLLASLGTLLEPALRGPNTA